MYSVTNLRSLRDAEFIHDNLLTNLMGTMEDIPIVLVGNKCDLDSDRFVARGVHGLRCIDPTFCTTPRQVSLLDGKVLAAKWGCPFIEASAKRNEHVGTLLRVRVSVTKPALFTSWVPQMKCSP